MKIPQTYLQKAKAGAHVAQAVLIFVGGCLALAVLTMGGGTSGEIGYFFGLVGNLDCDDAQHADMPLSQCFLSAPALVYLVMVPMWSRAWRFQNVYAYAAIDTVFAILWFAAFIAVAVWRGRGMGGGDGGDDDDDDDDDDGDDGDGGCASFEFGSERKCNVAGATIGFGVIICVLFIATSVLSARAVMEYKRTGNMPNGESTGRPQRVKTKTESHGNEDGVWSSNTNDLEHNDYDGSGADPRRAYGQIPTDDNESLLNDSGRRPSDPFNDDQGYSGGHAMHPGKTLSQQPSHSTLNIQPPDPYNNSQAHAGAGADDYIAPSALSPTDYGQIPGGRISFPHANYGADLR